MNDECADIAIAAIVVRPIIEADIARLCELEEHIFPDPWPQEAFREQTRGNEWGGFVAEINGTVIGYACFYIAVPEAHLTNIAVDPTWRRKSIAKRLLDNVLGVVRKSSCEFLLLEVRATNADAIAFYEQHEFRELYRRRNYYRRPVEDAVVMVRYFESSETDDGMV